MTCVKSNIKTPLYVVDLNVTGTYPPTTVANKYGYRSIYSILSANSFTALLCRWLCKQIRHKMYIPSLAVRVLFQTKKKRCVPKKWLGLWQVLRLLLESESDTSMDHYDLQTSRILISDRLLFFIIPRVLCADNLGPSSAESKNRTPLRQSQSFWTW